MDKSLVVVSGEDVESEDEFDRPTALQSLRSQSQSIVSGEAPESDVDDFGSTVSLGSSSPEPSSVSRKGRGKDSRNLPPLDRPTQPSQAVNLHPADILKQRDPVLYKKHVDKNRSLRNNYVEKILRPSLLQNIKKLDNVSQNLSNVQMALQEALLQSRLITGNLEKMKSEIDKFGQDDTESEISSDIKRMKIEESQS